MTLACAGVGVGVGVGDAAQAQVTEAKIPPDTRPTPGHHPATTRPLQALAPDVIHRAVVEAGRNISEAAKRLDVRRNTVDRKLRWNQTA